MTERSVSSGPQTASDNFDSYANNSTLNGQGNWLRLYGSVISLGVVNPSGSGRVVGNNGDVGNVHFYNAGTWAANQWSAATVFGTGGDIYAAVRCAGGSCYYVRATTGFGGYIIMGKFDSGSQTDNIASTAMASYAAGDIIRLEVSGSGASTRLTAKQNGVTKLSNVDPGGTYHSSGNPGMGQAGNQLFSTTQGITFWQASDI